MTGFLVKLLLGLVLPAVAAGWLLRRWVGAERFRALVARLLLLAVASTLCLFAGEWAVRIAFADVTTTADNSSWFARRWLEEVSYNRYGFRDRDFADRAVRGTYRIAIVGDSFAYGQGVGLDERFGERVERALNAESGTTAFEVVNFARPGAETEDHEAILDQSALAAHPDFVLLQWYVNDVEGVGANERPTPKGLVPSATLRSVLHRHSALYYLLNSRWAELQGRLGWVSNYNDYMRERFGDPDGEDWRRAEAALRRFIARCREADVRVGIVLFPSLVDQYALNYLHRRVLDVCEDERLECVDLAPVFAGEPSAQNLWVNRLDSHPGSRAHEIGAQAILERFAPVWRDAAAAAGQTPDR